MYELKQPVLLDGQPGRVWGITYKEKVVYDVLPDGSFSIQKIVSGVSVERLGAA